MLAASKAAGTFAVIAFLLILAVDAVLSLVYQAPPMPSNRTPFFVTHGIFHGAVLILSNIGALVGFTLVRHRLPTTRQTAVLAIAYAFTTVFAGVGSFMLVGAIGAATWLLLGSMAFALGSGVLSQPWRRSSGG